MQAQKLAISAPPQEVKPPAAAIALTILVADDNRDAADTLAVVLRMGGHQVHVVHDGLSALRQAMVLQPQVLILDIGMPAMTGLEVAARIRRQSWGARAFMIALTGWGQNEDRRKSMAAGFDEHLTKPAKTDAIEQLIGEFARRHAGVARVVSDA
jgi:CheY-like chemotaxis protein